jgi:zinc transporter ZupT
LIFAAAAPLTALISAFLLSGVSLDEVQMMKWTGLLLLFSGGSFLYVSAVHVLPESLLHGGGKTLQTYQTTFLICMLNIHMEYVDTFCSDGNDDSRGFVPGRACALSDSIIDE